MIYLLLFCLSFSSYSALQGQNYYDMADLETLAAENNFKEFIPHAHDIRPGKRDKKWRDMFINMLNLYLDHALEKASIDRKSFDKIESYVTLPSVAGDVFIQGKRETIATKYFRTCMKTNKSLQICRSQMARFWHQGSFSPDMGLTLGQMLQTMDPKFTMPFWHYYSAAVKSEQSEFYCKRTYVKRAILAYLNKTFMGTSPSKINNQSIKNLVSNDCWKTISPTLVLGLKSKDYNIKKLSYMALSSYRPLKKIEQDIFATHFLLDGPVVGELFNSAWKIMEEMGQDFKRRKEVLSILKKSPVLPDQLFRSYRPKKKKILVNFIADYFPEYIEHYAKTCLDYLEGKKSFSKGNPTVGCHDLFKLSAGATWPAPTTKQRYLSLPKF